MTIDAPAPASAPKVKSRDAHNTQQLLLRAAQVRFARDGYGATTVRDIATDAGVNVALIKRYFESKEGLFEACLRSAAEDLGQDDAGGDTIERVTANIIKHAAGTASGERQLHLQLLLVLRSSGDQNADRIREATLQHFAERMARAGGWKPGDPAGRHIMLRAQIALATALGIILLRFSNGLEPLASATEEELTAPLGSLVSALFTPAERPSP